MGVDSRFYLLERAPLLRYFEQSGKGDIVRAIDEERWEEVIYYDLAAYPKGIAAGWQELPKMGTYNRATSFQLLQLMADTREAFGFRRFEAGYSLPASRVEAWLNFMLALCRCIHESEYDEVLWDLWDVQAAPEHVDLLALCRCIHESEYDEVL